MKTIIKIANPVHNGKQYTSTKRALHFIRREEACFTDSGELFFFTPESVVRRRDVARTDAAIAQYRSGVVCWNGADRNPLATHRPGEARS